MIRLLGILLGAAIAVAALILLLGLPEFPDKSGQDALLTIADEVPSAVADEVPAAIVDEVPPAIADEAPADIVDPLPEIPAEPEQNLPPASAPDPGHWYAFWSPFRSEIAANGFVAQLQRRTGLDYRVVKLKPGVYEVAFAYSDDTDVETKLAQISAATGLDIPES